MDRVLKLTTILSVIVISFSVAYYLVIFLPKKEESRLAEQNAMKLNQAREQALEEEKTVSQKIEKCRGAGEKAYKSDYAIYGDESIEPKYTYSKEIDSCIYSGGYMHDDPNAKQCDVDGFEHDCNGHWERWVKNSYTNEKIISIYNFTDKTGMWVIRGDVVEKYWEKEKKLFNGN